VIDAIGPAPATGRDRWGELAGHFEVNAAPAGLEVLLQNVAFRRAQSDDRFTRVADLFGDEAAARRAGKENGHGGRHDVQSWGPSPGDTLVTLKHNARSCVVNIDQRQAPGLGDFLLRHMDRLYGEYLAVRKDR
jgi:ParB family chromosome partitioning protein